MKKHVEINQKSGTRLKELLTELHISQKVAAKEFNYTEQHISAVINGKRGLSKEFADIIVSKLDFIRREWLLGIDDTKTIYEYEFNEMIKLSDSFKEFFYNQTLSEIYVLISAKESGYEINNKEGSFSLERLLKKREELLKSEMQEISAEKPEGSNSMQFDSDEKRKLLNALFFAEQYDITYNSKIVATCDSNDIMEISGLLRKYLTFLLFQFVNEQNINNH